MVYRLLKSVVFFRQFVLQTYQHLLAALLVDDHCDQSQEDEIQEDEDEGAVVQWVEPKFAEVQGDGCGNDREVDMHFGVEMSVELLFDIG
jgi:hypothetical protein